MLFKINTVSTSIKGNEYSMSELYKSLSTQKDFQKRAELDKYYKKSAEEISAKTVELSSLVSMYSTFKCDIGDAIEQIACPDGWSKKCKLD
jgi:ABC-type multidrug transport system permease subunit